MSRHADGHPHAQRRRLRRVPSPSPIEGGGEVDCEVFIPDFNLILTQTDELTGF
jgi:hypothetical protein